MVGIRTYRENHTKFDLPYIVCYSWCQDVWVATQSCRDCAFWWHCVDKLHTCHQTCPRFGSCHPITNEKINPNSKTQMVMINLINLFWKFLIILWCCITFIFYCISFYCIFIIIVIDIDECTTLAPCHHTCTNNDGSYTCSCDAGFELNSDGLNCERELSHSSILYGCLLWYSSLLLGNLFKMWLEDLLAL